jgi:hypothetical protein
MSKGDDDWRRLIDDQRGDAAALMEQQPDPEAQAAERGIRCP